MKKSKEAKAKSHAEKQFSSLKAQNTKELNKRKRRMNIIDVEPDPITTASTKEAIERSKVLTFPCKDCGAETNPSNRSILQDGRTVHIGCPKKKNSSPREIEKRKPVLSGLPKHKGVTPPVREVPKKSEYGDIMVMCDHQGRTCIQVKRDISTVTFMMFDPQGIYFSYMPVQKFDERFKLIEYPVVKAMEHYRSYAVEYGATQDVLSAIARVVTITEEQHTMATKKQQGKITTDSNGKPKKPKGERKESASAMFKELIMKGGMTDDQIFSKVKEKFGLDDKKRGYVAWYRNHLKKEGKNPPEPKLDKKSAKKDEKPAKKTKGKK